jgi:hypothetical protein
MEFLRNSTIALAPLPVKKAIGRHHWHSEGTVGHPNPDLSQWDPAGWRVNVWRPDMGDVRGWGVFYIFRE